LIDSIVQFEVVGDFMFPCIVDRELQSLSVSEDCSNYLGSCSNFDFCTDSCTHTDSKEDMLFKCYAGLSSGLPTSQFIPGLKPLGILEVIS